MLDDLRGAYPWPAERPQGVDALRNAVRTGDDNYRLLASLLSEETKVVAEVGCWTGNTTRALCRMAPNALVLAIDHWRGSDEDWMRPFAEHLSGDGLYNTFLDECWDYRHRIVPIRELSLTGLPVVRSFNASPELIYIDAAHDYESVYGDAEYCLDWFPGAILVGDDWLTPSVQAAVKDVALYHGRMVEHSELCWYIRYIRDHERAEQRRMVRNG